MQVEFFKDNAGRNIMIESLLHVENVSLLIFKISPQFSDWLNNSSVVAGDLKPQLKKSTPVLPSVPGLGKSL